MIIKNAKAFINGKFAEGTDIWVKDGKITAIGQGLSAEGEEALDLQGDVLLPGFVDVHIHAFMGMDTMNGEAAVRHMSRELKKFGVAAFLPTTMSASAEDTLKALRGIKAVMDNPEPDGAIVLGAHMEAPFLTESKAGAQIKEYFQLPCEENWRRCTGECEGIVRMITLAPEKEGALDFIRWLSGRGITVSIGHTNATAEEVHAAAEHGADAGYQFLGVKRLDNVIISSKLQAKHLVKGFSFCGEHDNGHIRGVADFPAYLIAVNSRQHQIQKNQSGSKGIRQHQCCFSIRCDHGIKALLCQI